MAKTGKAVYLERTNELEVIRPGESCKRKIKCSNLNPKSDVVHGIEIDGDEIAVLVGPKNNPNPNRKILYSFGGLFGGSSTGL
jgi:hypothetical protein